jgi:hypothetical protein
MNENHIRRGVWTPLVLIVFACAVTSAQTTIEPPLVNPGARSLGLGGAFVAVADDATAAWANPSGLMQLVRPEISAELRSWSEDREGATSNQSNLGFLSFVLPREKWSLAIYGQTLSSLDFPESSLEADGEIKVLSSLVIANLGLSGALRVSEAVSLGLGVTVFSGDFTEGSFNPDDVDLLRDDDVHNELGATAGLLWTLDGSWSLGASYRSGTDFTFDRGGRATIPDILAAGARWRSASGAAVVAAEVEHLSGIDTRTRLHLGGEWVFLEAKPLIGLRAGCWHDPHGGAVSLDEAGEIAEADAVFHAAAGIGLAWTKFQLDLGADSSDRTTILAISGIYTF